MFRRSAVARDQVDALGGRPSELEVRAGDLLEVITEPLPIGHGSLWGEDLVDALSIGAISTDSEQINQLVVESVTKGSDTWGISSSRIEYSSFLYNTPSECSGLFGVLVRLAFVRW